MEKDIKIRDIDKLSYDDKREAFIKLASTTTMDEELNDLFNKINEKIAEISVREDMASRMIDEDYSDEEISYITRVRVNDVRLLRKRKLENS